MQPWHLCGPKISRNSLNKRGLFSRTCVKNIILTKSMIMTYVSPERRLLFIKGGCLNHLFCSAFWAPRTFLIVDQGGEASPPWFKIGWVFFTCSWGLFGYNLSFLFTVGERYTKKTKPNFWTGTTVSKRTKPIFHLQQKTKPKFNLSGLPTQTQNRSILATQFPKSQPCCRC